MDKLDDYFAQVLRNWATARLPEVEPEIAQSIAAVIDGFSRLIWQFPHSPKATNLEIAIKGYEVVTTVFTLWSVDDLATALFSIFYYQHRKQDFIRPAALKEAQKELRSLTGKRLATHYKPQLDFLLDKKSQQAADYRQEAKAYLEEVKSKCQEAEGTESYRQWDEEYKKWEKEYKRRNAIGKRIHSGKESLKRFCREPHPFSHPLYWAAFTCQGLR